MLQSAGIRVLATASWYDEGKLRGNLQDDRAETLFLCTMGIKTGGDQTMLERGIAGERTLVVTKDLTAKTMGSGELEVLATPAMIALIEETAWRSVASWLAPGQGTVGTKLEVSHVSATPVGLTVRCRTELTEIDRRKLVFSVSVYDDAGLIGEGTHERFIVDNDRFMAKAESKKKAPQKD